MRAHQYNERPDMQFAFANWKQIHDQYQTLRRLSDMEAHLSVQYPGKCMRTATLETEIDHMECSLEDAAAWVAQAPGRSSSDIDAILNVLMADLKIRHQIDDGDMAVHLILSAQRVLMVAT